MAIRIGRMFGYGWTEGTGPIETQRANGTRPDLGNFTVFPGTFDSVDDARVEIMQDFSDEAKSYIGDFPYSNAEFRQFVPPIPADDGNGMRLYMVVIMTARTVADKGCTWEIREI